MSLGTYWAQRAAHNGSQLHLAAWLIDGKEEPLSTFALLRGDLCWWWQVLGSNQRRLSRRFYRPSVQILRYALWPADTLDLVIFGAGSVRHMSVHDADWTGETTDIHGQRP
jgi:hypothetical protein